MKKFLSLFLTAALLFSSLLAFSSCGMRIEYEGAENYTAGAFKTEEKITSLEIFWDGNFVSVSGAFTDKIKAEEDYFETDKKALRYLVEDGVLKIYPCASGARPGKLNKSLLLTLPMEIANNLKSVTINAYDDTKVVLQLLKIDKLTVVAEDGSVKGNGTFDDVSVQTQKGSLTLVSPELSNLKFVSDIGSANLSLHLQGFAAVMQGDKGEFTTTYDVTENNRLYTYGTQGSLLTFMTAGNVTLDDTDVTK